KFLQTGVKPAEGLIVLHDLSKAFGSDDDEDSSDTKSTSKNGAAASGFIPTELAEDLKARLKILPRAQIDKFLARLGVDAIKKVKSEDADKAKAFVVELEGKDTSSNSQAVQENDPFA